MKSNMNKRSAKKFAPRKYVKNSFEFAQFKGEHQSFFSGPSKFIRSSTKHLEDKKINFTVIRDELSLLGPIGHPRPIRSYFQTVWEDPDIIFPTEPPPNRVNGPLIETRLRPWCWKRFLSVRMKVEVFCNAK